MADIYGAEPPEQTDPNRLDSLALSDPYTAFFSNKLPLVDLNPIEVHVLDRVSRGASNLCISHEMELSLGSINKYLSHILYKSRAHNRTEAVYAGFLSGTITPDANQDKSVQETKLTPMEVNELFLVVHGLTNANSAKLRGVSEETPKLYRRLIRGKLGAHTMPHVMRRAWERGMLPFSDQETIDRLQRIGLVIPDKEAV